MITVLPGMRGIGGLGREPSKITLSIQSAIEHALSAIAANVDPEEAEVAIESIIRYFSIIHQTHQSASAEAAISSIISHLQTVFGPGVIPATAAISAGSIISHLQTVFGPGVQPQSAAASINSILLYEPA